MRIHKGNKRHNTTGSRRHGRTKKSARAILQTVRCVVLFCPSFCAGFRSLLEGIAHRKTRAPLPEPLTCCVLELRASRRVLTRRVVGGSNTNNRRESLQRNHHHRGPSRRRKHHTRNGVGLVASGLLESASEKRGQTRTGFYLHREHMTAR